MTQSDHITEAELHAYIDGQLDAARLDAVEAYLAANPSEAARLTEYAQINDDLQAAFDLDESIPDTMQAVLHPPMPARRAWQMPNMTNIAAGVALLITGVALGWAIRPAPAAQMLFANEAVSAHDTYAVEVLHPVEVASDQQDHLVKWLSNRLGADIKAPDLAARGFTLLGGRLLPSETGPAAQFMYENAAGRRITLYATDSGDSAETSFKFAKRDGFEVFYWQDTDISYALVGDISKEELRTLAVAVYSQLI